MLMPVDPNAVGCMFSRAVHCEHVCGKIVILLLLEAQVSSPKSVNIVRDEGETPLGLIPLGFHTQTIRRMVSFVVYTSPVWTARGHREHTSVMDNQPTSSRFIIGNTGQSCVYAYLSITKK